MMNDCLGNAVTPHDAASLPALNDFVEGFLRCEARAVNVLALAQSDGSAIAQAYCAALHMFAESREGPVNARPFIDAAGTAAPKSTDREQRFVAAVKAWVDTDLPLAIRRPVPVNKDRPR